MDSPPGVTGFVGCDDVQTLEISIVYDVCDVLESPDAEFMSSATKSRLNTSPYLPRNTGIGSTGSCSSSASNDKVAMCR